jgi:hypothetical protein
MVVIETLHFACMSVVSSNRGCDELVGTMVYIKRDANCSKVVNSNLKNYEAVERSKTVVRRHSLSAIDNLWALQANGPTFGG